MDYYAYGGVCLARTQCAPIPPVALRVSEPFDPVVYLFHDLSPQAAGLIRTNGKTLLNAAYANAYAVLDRMLAPPQRFRLNLVGLGDVGGTLLTGLKLLGHDVEQIGIFDPDEARMARYEMELNQILPIDDKPLPKVVCIEPDQLFACDALLFTASKGVPPLGQGGDVRMAQYAANAAMLAGYAKQAREQRFTGLFCQISDPVDHLARSLFLASNRQDDGPFDGCGLLPEQVQGYGLGVMAARAAYYAEKEGVDFSQGRAYGPHGAGLVIANAPGKDYDDALSRHLTDLAREANLQVRALGYKPYIAPGLSSACVSVLQTLRGSWHLSCVPVKGVYFGCKNRFGALGLELFEEDVHPLLQERLQACYKVLQEAMPL